MIFDFAPNSLCDRVGQRRWSKTADRAFLHMWYESAHFWRAETGCAQSISRSVDQVCWAILGGKGL